MAQATDTKHEATVQVAPGVPAELIVPIGKDASDIQHSFDITALTDPAVRVKMSIEISEDGAPFIVQNVMEYVGGNYTDPRGLPATMASFECGGRREGLCSVDGGHNWSTLRDRSNDEIQLLIEGCVAISTLDPATQQAIKGIDAKVYSASRDAKKLLTIRDRPFKNPVIRKTFTITGNQSPVSLATESAWK